MSTLTEQLSTIVTELETATRGRGLDVTVTADPHDAGAALAAGARAILVTAGPSIEFTTITQREYTWTAWALTGSGRDPVPALEALEKLLELADETLWITTARPYTLELNSGLFPGYEIEFTTHE
ncbi:hypothetical protein [Dermabacter sp. HSID17554]|uniref:hypothetical protein n=1 Tax=Dermabacter sp. HSID17554 TaxID=2419511 RepID=UPI000F860001|nr:hypothetical protein [Dermabacter sp. HSID17554]RUP86586.1 hypothetical protein D8M36_04170 [Dermabacter sp. HSID17554]